MKAQHSLALDAHGKTLGSAVLDMGVDLEVDGPAPQAFRVTCRRPADASRG